jgi:hypothetical protein
MCLALMPVVVSILTPVATFASLATAIIAVRSCASCTACKVWPASRCVIYVGYEGWDSFAAPVFGGCWT